VQAWTKESFNRSPDVVYGRSLWLLYGNAVPDTITTILVVDDEPVVVAVARMTLEHAGYCVVTASSGAEASEAAAKLERVDVLLVDHRIPPDRGRDIADRLLRTHPAMRVMQFSGWAREHLEAEGSLTPGAAFLAKPFTSR
jgi:two-component system, cell cycle sensor histidine kinase and response regulator CckA